VNPLNNETLVNRRHFLALAALGAAALSCRRLPRVGPAAAAPPSSSWAHVPVYAHLGKSNGDFTPAELDFLAEHFNFICIEKGQAGIWLSNGNGNDWRRISMTIWDSSWR
jgi:hypothetical protein